MSVLQGESSYIQLCGRPVMTINTRVTTHERLVSAIDFVLSTFCFLLGVRHSVSED